MFWPDVIELKQFYSSPTGKVACALIQRRILAFWPENRDETVVGIGYTAPFLTPYLSNAMLVASFMPPGQGALYWPVGHDNLTSLSNETALPLADNSVNRVLLVHSLENSEHMRDLVQEVWRILTPGGRVLMVVPNRRGVWARVPQSPFANGRPFSASQLRQLVCEHMFTPTRTATALFVPPTKLNFLLRAARMIEFIGRHLFTGFGGMHFLEAEKQIYASTRESAMGKARQRYQPVPRPVMTHSKP